MATLSASRRFSPGAAMSMRSRPRLPASWAARISIWLPIP